MDIENVCGQVIRSVPGETLGNADLRGANLRYANLTRANLTRADLRGADLRGADLTGASLRDADLTVAALTRAYLRDADLRGADLRGADLRGADLRSALLRSATMPDGRTWEDYRADPLAGVCDTPEALERARAGWGNHTWRDCPMAQANGWHGMSDVPAEKRIAVGAFVAIFDAGLLAQEV